MNTVLLRGGTNRAMGAYGFRAEAGAGTDEIVRPWVWRRKVLGLVSLAHHGTRALTTGTIHTAYSWGFRMFAIIRSKYAVDFSSVIPIASALTPA